MKKWQIISIAVAAVIALLVSGGALIYKYYVVPKFMEPLAEKITDLFASDDVVDELYDVATEMHDNGTLDDDTYSSFVKKYKSRKKAMSDDDFLRMALEGKAQDGEIVKDGEFTARYAANRVGVQMIQTDDGTAEGKADTRYSTERTSDRLKAEDIIAAEKMLADDEALADAEEEERNKKIERILNRMTGEDRPIAMRLMSKVDLDYALQLYYSDYRELKEYLKSCLNEDEINELKVLAVKYSSIAMEEK